MPCSARNAATANTPVIPASTLRPTWGPGRRRDLRDGEPEREVLDDRERDTERIHCCTWRSTCPRSGRASSSGIPRPHGRRISAADLNRRLPRQEQAPLPGRERFGGGAPLRLWCVTKVRLTTPGRVPDLVMPGLGAGPDATRPRTGCHDAGAGRGSCDHGACSGAHFQETHHDRDGTERQPALRTSRRSTPTNRERLRLRVGASGSSSSSGWPWWPSDPQRSASGARPRGSDVPRPAGEGPGLPRGDRLVEGIVRARPRLVAAQRGAGAA